MVALVLGLIAAVVATIISVISSSLVGDYDQAWLLIVQVPMIWASIIFARERPSQGSLALIAMSLLVSLLPVMFPVLMEDEMAGLAWLFVWAVVGLPLFVSGLLFLLFSRRRGETKEKYAESRKPAECPQCGSRRIALSESTAACLECKFQWQWR